MKTYILIVLIISALGHAYRMWEAFEEIKKGTK